MTTTFLNSGENGGGEKEDAKMVREAMEEVVERAAKKLERAKCRRFAMLFATPEAMRNLTTTTGKEEDEDEKKKKKKKKMAKSAFSSSRRRCRCQSCAESC